MKRLTWCVILPVLIMSGCALSQYYEKPYMPSVSTYQGVIPKYTLGVGTYYLPRVEGSEKLENEVVQVQQKSGLFFIIPYGKFVVEKLQDVFNKMFSTCQRLDAATIDQQIEEGKQNGLTLICNIKVLEYNFNYEQSQGVLTGAVKDTLLGPFSKTPFRTNSHLKIRITFHDLHNDEISRIVKIYHAPETVVHVALGAPWTNPFKPLVDGAAEDLDDMLDEVVEDVAQELKNNSKYQSLLEPS